MEYNLKEIKDNRGIFCEIYKENLEDKFHYLQLSPNKKEVDISIIQKLKNFFVISGKGKFCLKIFILVKALLLF